MLKKIPDREEELYSIRCYINVITKTMSSFVFVQSFFSLQIKSNAILYDFIPYSLEPFIGKMVKINETF